MDLTGEPLETPDSLFMNDTGVPLLGVLSPIVGFPLKGVMRRETSPEQSNEDSPKFGADRALTCKEKLLRYGVMRVKWPEL